MLLKQGTGNRERESGNEHSGDPHKNPIIKIIIIIIIIIIITIIFYFILRRRGSF